MCDHDLIECTNVIYITFLRSTPVQNITRPTIRMAPESSHSSTSNVWNKNPSSTFSSFDQNPTSSFSDFPPMTKHISSSSKNEQSSNASRSGSNASRSGSNFEKRQPEVAAANTLTGSAPSGSNQVIQWGSDHLRIRETTELQTFTCWGLRCRVFQW